MKNTFNRILVLSPHPDDGELGCGASVNHFIKEGAFVSWIVFSSINPNIKPFTRLLYELGKSTKLLGVKDVQHFDMPMRMLHEQRQAILDKLFDIKEDYEPDLVFCPSPNDIHSDHRTIALETMRAFKHVTTLAYECSWNNSSFKTEAFVKIKTSDLDIKLKALACYGSMKDKSYFQKDYIIGLAVTRGIQAASTYAEAFEVLRYIVN